MADHRHRRARRRSRARRDRAAGARSQPAGRDGALRGARVSAIEQRRSRSFSWEDPAATAAAAVGLSGLQTMRAIVDGTLAPPPIARMLDFEIVEVENGRAVFATQPAEWMYNPIGMVH